MDFKAQYLDPRWQKKRLEVMESARFACQECKSTGSTLNIHHIKYETGLKVWEYPVDYYRCLCETCHGKHHKLDNVLLFETRDLNIKDKLAVLELVWGFRGTDYGKN